MPPFRPISRASLGLQPTSSSRGNTAFLAASSPLRDWDTSPGNVKNDAQKRMQALAE